MLRIDGLKVAVGGHQILNGVTLEIKPGQVHALMGPNGAGKTSLVYALIGHPAYKITGGQITIDNKDITKLKPNERAKRGLFLSFQNPPSIPGVGVASFLHLAKGHQDFSQFYRELKRTTLDLHLEEEFLHRSLNEDFSGGEKKKMELLQALTLKPKFVIFDEIDTGLDIDALKLVAEKINFLKDGRGILLITHYQRILRYLTPDRVWVMKEGKIVVSGGEELVKEIEEKGYEKLK